MTKKPKLKAKDKWTVCAMVACLLDGQFTLTEIKNNFWAIVEKNYEQMLLTRDATVLINSEVYQNALALKNSGRAEPKDDRLATTPKAKMSIAMWLMDRFEDKDEAVLFVKKARSLYT
mgnify:CR=1 FL=1